MDAAAAAIQLLFGFDADMAFSSLGSSLEVGIRSDEMDDQSTLLKLAVNSVSHH